VDSVDRYPDSVSGASQITSGNGTAFRLRDDLNLAADREPEPRTLSGHQRRRLVCIARSRRPEDLEIPIGRFIDGVAKNPFPHNRYGAGIVNGKLKPEQNRFAPPILATGLGQ
jgi:hypothetical protein